jgi:hypothetical protein
MKKSLIFAAMGFIAFNGCDSTAGNGNAPKYAEMTKKEAILIAHHYPQETCSAFANSYPSSVVAFTTNEIYCEDYGREDDGIECEEEDYAYLTDVHTEANCIVGANESDLDYYGKRNKATSENNINDLKTFLLENL